MSSISVMM